MEAGAVGGRGKRAYRVISDRHPPEGFRLTWMLASTCKGVIAGL